MPLSPEQFHDRACDAADAAGRLPVAGMTGWEVFPFEPDGLTVVPLAGPVLPEPPRNGEAGVPCVSCRPDRPRIWSDEHWRISASSEPTGAPLLLMLHPHEHHDLPTLPDDRASELGRLIVHLVRAVEALPHIARAHVSRWGDGGAHLHLFVYARPAGFAQLRGTCLAIWDDLLPAVPADVRDADAAAVARALASSYGGTSTI